MELQEKSARAWKDKGWIDCGTNNDMFLAIAALANNTDLGQWLIVTDATGDRWVKCDKNKAFILGTRKTGCDLIVLGGTNCNEGSMDWLFGSLGNENFYVCQPAYFYKSQQEIEKMNPLYAFKVATAYFRGQGLVPVFEDGHCRLIILRYGVG